VTVAIRVRLLLPTASRWRDGPFGPARWSRSSNPAVEGRATEAAVRAVAQALGPSRDGRVRPAN
jgi:hypothetical protein